MTRDSLHGDTTTAVRGSREIGKTASVGLRQGYAVYEAIQPQECWDCGKTIEPGERFTRRMVKGGGSRRWAFCSSCDDAEVAR